MIKTLAKRLKNFFVFKLDGPITQPGYSQKKEEIPVADIDELKTSSDNVIDQVLIDVNSENNEKSNG